MVVHRSWNECLECGQFLTGYTVKWKNGRTLVSPIIKKMRKHWSQKDRRETEETGTTKASKWVRELKKKKKNIEDNCQLNASVAEETLENEIFIRILYVINKLKAIYQWNAMTRSSIPRNDTWEWTAPA